MSEPLIRCAYIWITGICFGVIIGHWIGSRRIR